MISKLLKCLSLLKVKESLTVKGRPAWKITSIDLKLVIEGIVSEYECIHNSTMYVATIDATGNNFIVYKIYPVFENGSHSWVVKSREGIEFELSIDAMKNIFLEVGMTPIVKMDEENFQIGNIYISEIVLEPKVDLVLPPNHRKKNESELAHIFNSTPAVHF